MESLKGMRIRRTPTEELIVMHDLQAIIDGLPGIYLIVAADAEYTMVASSDERLRVTMTRRKT